MSNTLARRPGRADITKTRSDRKTASAMLWVMKTMVLLGLQPDLLDQQVHLVAGEGIERAERLVHQEHGGIERQRTHDGGALLHAAR